MDASQLAGGNIPPEALAALQQQQGGGMDITAILAQLSQMSPDEVSSALAQLGINVPPKQLQQAAEQWVEQAGDKAALKLSWRRSGHGNVWSPGPLCFLTCSRRSRITAFWPRWRWLS
jgi:hypothetical protein